MIRRPPRSTQSRSSAASDVYKRQLEDHGTKRAELVRQRLDGLEVLDEADSFLECFDDLLVVQAVGRGLLHRAPVDDVRASPELHEPREVRRLAGARRALALQADRVSMLELAGEQPPLLDGESGQDGGLSLPGGERLETPEGLLDAVS